MNFFVAYPATSAAKREKLIIFRCVIGKKELPKKNVITTDGVNRIPTRSWESFLDSLFAKDSFWLWKRLNAGRLLEESPFAEGHVWMVSLQRAP